MTDSLKDLGFTLKTPPKVLTVTSGRPYLIVEGNAKLGTYLSVCMEGVMGRLVTEPTAPPTEMTVAVIRILQRVASDDDLSFDAMRYDATDNVFRATKMLLPVCKGIAPPYLAYEMLGKTTFWDTLAAQLQESLHLKEPPANLRSGMEMIMEELIDSSRTEPLAIPDFKIN